MKTQAIRLARGFGAAALAVWWLAGCAGAPVPPTVWLRLPVLPGAAPGGVPAVAAAPAPSAPPVLASREVWQWSAPVPMPAHLDRDTVFVPQGAAGTVVQPLAGARWVEPLRDAVPRLLREDLARELDGQPVWTGPLPPGLAPTRLLRVEITALEVDADGQALLAQARWWIAEPRGARAPLAHEARVRVEAEAAADRPATAAAWALAHRRAIALLAARIAATMKSVP